MADKTVTFKLPDDEVDALDQEADDKNQNRSEYLREIIRKRDVDIESELDEQGLTKADRDRMEDRIEQLESANSGLQSKVRSLRDENEAIKDTFADEHEKAIRAGLSEMEETLTEEVQELNERDKRLRAENEQLRESVKEIAAELKELNVATAEDLEYHEDTVCSLATTLQEEVIQELDQSETRVTHVIRSQTDDAEATARHSRAPTTKLADWLRSLLSRS